MPDSRTLAVMLILPVLASCGRDSPDPQAFRVDGDRAGVDGGEPPACESRSPRRTALFGDLHVHTALSTDAWNYDVEVRPEQAYAYAFGDPIELPPRDAEGRGTRVARIGRPLDFAAVTDHAEFLGEQRLCSTPGSDVYATRACSAIRDAEAPLDSPLALTIMNPFPSREREVCGKTGERCDSAGLQAWRETIEAAEAWNDTSTVCPNSGVNSAPATTYW
jgi:hypothetical protein